MPEPVTPPSGCKSEAQPGDQECEPGYGGIRENAPDQEKAEERTDHCAASEADPELEPVAWRINAHAMLSSSNETKQRSESFGGIWARSKPKKRTGVSDPGYRFRIARMVQSRGSIRASF